MKKILVILMMCVVCNASVEAKTKKTTRKAKAKTERAMTDFEKWQKEEKLTYLLGQCDGYYKKAKSYSARKSFSQSWADYYYSEAEKFKREYEETAKNNYYIDLTKFYQDFYNGGYSFGVCIFSDGRVEWYGDGIDFATCNRDNIEFKKMRADLANEIIERINEQIGRKAPNYNEKNAKLEGFINQHK